MNYKFVSLTTWPRAKNNKPTGGPFSADFNSTLAFLGKELENLKARNVVIQLSFTPDKLRRDGLPYADAKPHYHGVLISFDSKHGALSFAADSLIKWQHNVRAIAYHLEHLRLSQLYGVGTAGEPYRGYLALPPPDSPPALPDAAVVAQTFRPSGQSEEIASALLYLANTEVNVSTVQAVINEPDTRRKIYNRALQIHHTDNGGTVENFLTVKRHFDWLQGRKP